MVTRDEFHARLRSLLNIDYDDVPWMSVGDWTSFREDPFRFFIRCDDETAEKIWQLVERRNRPRQPTAALSRAMGGGDDLLQTIVDICRPPQRSQS
jgi:hypothetical protein